MAVNDSFNNLINDLSQQVLEQVQQQIQSVITETVNQRLSDLLSGDTIHKIVISRVNENLQNYTPDLSKFEQSLQDISKNITSNLEQTAQSEITNILSDKIESLNIGGLVEQFVLSKMDETSAHLNFKEKSISGNSIDTESLQITGDNILGGVIKNFGSTGIDDQAASCQITVLDIGTVFENTVYAGKLEVKGGAIIDGDLTILGKVTDNPAYRQLVADVGEDTKLTIGPDLLIKHQENVFEQLRTDGINLSKIQLDGKVIIDGDRLTSAILNSQLQTVGVLKDLQTQGEALLSKTLYTNNKRVGINTMDPKTALSIWDEEIEIGIGKVRQDIAEIGTDRNHTLILSSNKQNNITMTPDGVTAIPKLKLGNMLVSSAPTPPHYKAAKGTIVFNEQPNIGGPLGWVSLGDAKWANFGIID
jgi:hypothetical protein